MVITNKGKKRKKESDETRKKKSEAHKKLWQNPKYREQQSIVRKDRYGKWNKGKKKSKKWRENMSRRILGNKYRLDKTSKLSEEKRNLIWGKTLDKNPNWKGGKSFEPYSVEFNKSLKEKIKNRDNYICQLCNIKEQECKEKHGRVLAVHHINYNKQDNKTNNLICLCHFCNASVNKNRENWTSFFQTKLLKQNIGI